ncbi:hypothetical protein B0H65DRAFT_30968 [Neurospora tetraspora]|uniref:Secreted protein n=1 Tax=Neurospora tetraspora TaxID=94610 RepID=A0AAE0JNW6_9PEZI|nr:hypothetical protein B0H65DRAFT_30968 [Neurospora tetraspora]
MWRLLLLGTCVIAQTIIVCKIPGSQGDSEGAEDRPEIICGSSRQGGLFKLTMTYYAPSSLIKSMCWASFGYLARCVQPGQRQVSRGLSLKSSSPRASKSHYRQAGATRTDGNVTCPILWLQSYVPAFYNAYDDGNLGISWESTMVYVRCLTRHEGDGKEVRLDDDQLIDDPGEELPGSRHSVSD